MTAELVAAQILETFETELARQQKTELAKAYAVLKSIAEVAELDEPPPEVLPRRESLKTAKEIAEHYRPASDEVAAALSELIGEAGRDVQDSMRYYRALCKQGDFIDRKRRSDVLRLSNRARRKIHSAARRRSHGMKGGLLQRKYLGEVLKEIGK